MKKFIDLEQDNKRDKINRRKKMKQLKTVNANRKNKFQDISIQCI